MAEQRERVREKIASGEFAEKYHRISETQLTTLVDKAYTEDPDLEQPRNQWIRRGNLKEALADPRRRELWGNSGNRDPYAVPSGQADTSQDYEKWAQGYRHIGDFIDCSNMFHDNGGSHDDGEDEGGCARWAAWCAYVDPYYTGGEYSEYFGDNPQGKMDCHRPDTTWLLLGCYSQEMYQFYEQISKHVWAQDDYEYVTALAGLQYMTDEDCQGPYSDSSNREVYFGPMPSEGAAITMGAYTNDQCTSPDEETTSVYDDFFEGGGVDLGSNDDDNVSDDIEGYWYDAQKYTMENFNDVYSSFLYCTSCIDYPTYQDGFFIGDSGTDDDDLINQCWKFYSHDSYNCKGDCLAQAALQGTITSVSYNGYMLGTTLSGQYSNGKSSSSAMAAASKAQGGERLKANLYLTLAGIVFVATFLAFAVARGSSKKKKSSSRSRSRRLLDADYGGSDRLRSSSRAKSKSSSGGRSSSRSTSKARSSSDRSKSRSRKPEDGYSAPSSSDRARSKSRSRKSSSSRK